MAIQNENMENRVVLELIKKDLSDLKILVEELQNEELPNQVLIDICVGKAKTLSQEFSLLQGIEPINEFNREQAENDTTNESFEPEFDILTEEEQEESDVAFEEAAVEEPLIEIEEEEEEEEEEVDDEIHAASELEIEPTTLEKNDSVLIEEEPEEEIVVEEEIIEEEEEEVVMPDEPEVPIEEEQIPEEEPAPVVVQKAPSVEIKEEPLHEIELEEKVEEKKVFGEKFATEPTLNERLATNTAQESKIKGMPVTSLRKAIGLNDKFMFTRELFGNDHDKFEKSITALDNCKNLLQAIDYLEKNFKWTKSDTSLKFIALVKQRFSN